MKLYLARWEFAEKGSDIHGWFSISPDSAATWTFRDVAEVHARDFNRHGVTLTTQGGDTQKLRNFTIEARTDIKLVLACDAPFFLADPRDEVQAV